MRYIITKTEPFLRYFDSSTDANMMCKDMYSLFDLSCIAISEPLFDLIPAGFEEITENEATNGSNFFGEIRGEVKVWDVDSSFAFTDAIPDTDKAILTMTPEIIADTVQFMYRFAKEIIETEYNLRFKSLRSATEIEQASWDIQKHEAKEWLEFGGTDGHITPFLDYMSTERAIDKTELSNKILVNAELWNDKLSTLLVESQVLLKKFEVTTIWDMNILYEDIFGIMMPNDQALELKRCDESGLRTFVAEDGTLMLDMNNPYIGNKLNF